MSTERERSGQPSIEPVIAAMQEKIRARYPTARFEVFDGEDPKGTYLRAIVDVEDTDEVVDLVIDRLLDLQIEERLPLYFVAGRPPERALGRTRSQAIHQQGTPGRAFLP